MTLDRERWTDAGETDTASFSPVRQATVDVAAPGGRVVRLDILARDTTDDAVVDYYTLIVARPDGTAALVLVRYLEENGWSIARKAPAVGGPRSAQICATSGIAQIYVDPALAPVARALGIAPPRGAVPAGR